MVSATPEPASDVSSLITSGGAVLGVELGSTRIKATLIDGSGAPLAQGSHSWENVFSDKIWTYSLDAAWAGIQDCIADLFADTEQRYGVRPAQLRALGISGMMHGYLPFDADDNQLAPFRTWRTTTAGPAAAALTEAFAFNIPLRWSVAQAYQAILDAEPHVRQVSFLTTLAGYVHWKLTGERVVGIGEASGMFPIDPATGTYDAAMLATFDSLAAQHTSYPPLGTLLPAVLPAGTSAGTLTATGAALLDPSGTLQPGIPLCPPEGDADTGMVATNAVQRRTGNVSVGTSVFAMVVLEKSLTQPHPEIDMITTPVGDPVAMVHSNNGAGELAAWVSMFRRFAEALGHPASADDAFATVLREALTADPDADGILTYNYVAGEPVAGTEEGRPLLVRMPESTLSLANFARSQLYGIFGTLSLGMEILTGEGVAIDAMYAHGGLFRTEGIAQRFLAAALNAPVAVGEAAGEGGPWGIAVLAAYLDVADETSLPDYLNSTIFAAAEVSVVQPRAKDLAGYNTFLAAYRTGLAIERTAVEALPRTPPPTDQETAQ
ncbi:MAG: xylulokinase [Propioniciclava sp.]